MTTTEPMFEVVRKADGVVLYSPATRERAEQYLATDTRSEAWIRPVPVIRTEVLVEVGDSGTLDGEVGIFTAARVDIANRWNGWLAAPMFTLAEAQRVIAYIASMADQNPEGEVVAYDEATDSITLTNDFGNGPEVHVEPPTVVDGVTFYTIGGGGWTWSEYKRPATAQDVPDMVRVVAEQILEDIREGRVPETVTSFSELHDHVDANTYGGMADDDSDLDWVHDEDDAANTVQNRVDVWLRAGRPPFGAIIAADVTADAPYWLTVEPFGDKFAGQIWERSAASGEFISTGFGSRFDTEREAHQWAVAFAGAADGGFGSRSVAVVEV